MPETVGWGLVKIGKYKQAVVYSRRMASHKTLIVISVLIVSTAVYIGVVYALEARVVATFQAQIVRAPIEEQFTLYRQLIESVGPSRAQDILSISLPYGVRVHLINHVTGQFLYETEGLLGIEKCKPYFVGSCYHGFIIAEAADKGINTYAIDELLGPCEAGLSGENPRDCAHGLGHALLQHVGYANLSQALALCRQSFEDDLPNMTFCYNGIFMENSFGTTSKKAQAGHLYKMSDPMYPCDDKKIMGNDPLAHRMCWITQSLTILDKNIYPQLGGSIANTAKYCGAFPLAADRDTCFRSIARQIQMGNMSNWEATRTQCEKLGSERKNQCVWDAAAYAYHYGDYTNTARVCAAETDISYKALCYKTLFKGIALSYYADEQRTLACKKLPDAQFQEECLAWMRTPEANES